MLRDAAELISAYHVERLDGILNDVSDFHWIADAYGVWVEKAFTPKLVSARSERLSSSASDGRVKAVLPEVKPDEHLARVLDLFR